MFRATFAAAIEAAGRAIEEAEQKSLAEYIVRRKVVLDFIEIMLEMVRDDHRDCAYQREDKRRVTARRKPHVHPRLYRP
jgi:carbamoylphosphate synthase large subunit